MASRLWFTAVNNVLYLYTLHPMDTKRRPLRTAILDAGPDAANIKSSAGVSAFPEPASSFWRRNEACVVLEGRTRPAHNRRDEARAERVRAHRLAHRPSFMQYDADIRRLLSCFHLLGRSWLRLRSTAYASNVGVVPHRSGLKGGLRFLLDD